MSDKEAKKLEEIEMLKLSNLELQRALLERNVQDVQKATEELVKVLEAKYCDEGEKLSLQSDGTIVRNKKE